jgi:hypothetical protein
MSALNENALTKLVTVASVDMQTVGLTTLYTVPAGKTMYPFAIIVRTTSDSLAGGTDYDFGTGASANTWKQGVNLSTMTTAGTDYWIIAAATKFTYCAAGSVFGIYVNTGSTAAATATIDLIGFLA